MPVLVYDGSEYTMGGAEAEKLKESIKEAVGGGKSVWLDMDGEGGERISVLVGPGIPMAFRQGVEYDPLGRIW